MSQDTSPDTTSDATSDASGDIAPWSDAPADKDALIRSLRDQIAVIERRNLDIQALNRRLLDAEQRAAQVAQQRDAIAKLSEKHAALEETHKQLQLAYTVLERARLDLARELDLARAEALQAGVGLEAAEAKVRHLEASASWRITRPLRWVTRGLHRGRRGDALGD